MIEQSVVAKAAEQVTGLDVETLSAAHRKAHEEQFIASDEGLLAHHLITTELAKRGEPQTCGLPALLSKTVTVSKATFLAKESALPELLVDALRDVFNAGPVENAMVMTGLGEGGFEVYAVEAPADMGDVERIWAELQTPLGEEPEQEAPEAEEEEEEEEEPEVEVGSSVMGRLFAAIADIFMGVEKGYTFEVENSLIQRNKRRKDSIEEHDFQAAVYTTRKGAKRCLKCGGMEPAFGKCNQKQSFGNLVFTKMIREEDGLWVVYDHSGKRKFGSYETEAEARDRLAQVESFSKAETFTPPQAVQEEAKRALEWLKEGKAGSGFTDVGRARASQLANGEAVSLDTIRRMSSFLARHAVDAEGKGYSPDDDGYPSAGRVAYAAWGGKPAIGWTKSILERADKSAPLLKADEKRFTLAPMYIPDTEDAHGEWTDADELQEAVWNYVGGNDRRIRLQHRREVVAGEWVEIMAWPFPITVPMRDAEGNEQNVSYPANTVFMGIKWEPWAWELVKTGKISGLSIGGKAQRIEAAIPEMEKGEPSVGSVHIDTPIGAYPKKPKKEF